MADDAMKLIDNAVNELRASAAMNPALADGDTKAARLYRQTTEAWAERIKMYDVFDELVTAAIGIFKSEHAAGT